MALRDQGSHGLHAGAPLASPRRGRLAALGRPRLKCSKTRADEVLLWHAGPLPAVKGTRHPPHGCSTPPRALSCAGPAQNSKWERKWGGGEGCVPSSQPRAHPASPAEEPAWLHFHALPSATQAPSGGTLALNRASVCTDGAGEAVGSESQMGAAATRARCRGRTGSESVQRMNQGLQSEPTGGPQSSCTKHVGRVLCPVAAGALLLALQASALSTCPVEGGAAARPGALEEGPWERRGHVLQVGFCTGLFCIFRKSCTKLGPGQLKGHPSAADSGVGSYSAAGGGGTPARGTEGQRLSEWAEQT